MEEFDKDFPADDMQDFDIEPEMETDGAGTVDCAGTEMYEHFRFVVDKGQQLLRVDKYLVTRMENHRATASSRPPMQVAFWSMAKP